jgi:outer membrane protein assembly factor BamD
MRFRNLTVALMSAALLGGLVLPSPSALAAQSQQPARSQGEGTSAQRLAVLRSRLDTLRRTLNGALASLNASGDADAKKGKDDKKATDTAASRLSGLEREASRINSDVVELTGKVERADKFDATEIDRLEAAFADLNTRAESALVETAGERRTATAANAGAPAKKKKKGGGFLGIGKIFGGGDDDEKYADLIGGVAPGRDRQLFEEAAKLARKDNYEGARLLFNVIITTYPESPYLPHAKLAIADTFFLEGTTSSLIQAGNAYQEWLTFFPTDPLSDEVMLKVAEVEMRQMGLPDRDPQHARKAEQRLKALLQQFPDTSLRPEVQIRINQVQENLGMHTFQVGNFYMDRYLRGVAPNPKGAQSRYLETVQKFPNFSRLDKALYMLAETYIAEEQPDEATKYLQRILRDFPNSEFAEKAGEQLDAIGAEKPAADPDAAKRLPPTDKGMLRRFIDQVAGTTEVTVDDNGVLISKDSKEPALIDVIIENKGVLPVTTPTAPMSSRRIAPARAVTQQPAAQPGQKGGQTVSPQPAKPGPPATTPATDPTKPPTAPPPGL